MSTSSQIPEPHDGSFRRFDDFTYRDGRGNCRFKIGTVLNLYYFDGKSKGKLDVRLKILQDFLTISKGRINTYNPLNANKVKNADELGILNYFTTTNANPKAFLGIMSAGHQSKTREYGEPQSYLIHLAAGPVDSQLSQIICYLPGHWLDPGPHDTVLALMKRWGSWIGASHGTAGLGLQFNWAAAYQGIETAFPYLKRHPGLELGDTSLWMLEMKRRQDQRFIRSTNWLTLIDDGFVEALGGRSPLEARLDPVCPIHDFEGGIIIQAGKKPEAGDVNHGLIPAAYRTVARALKPIRYENFHRFGIFDPPEPLDPFTESLAWVRRFD